MMFGEMCPARDGKLRDFSLQATKAIVQLLPESNKRNDATPTLPLGH